MSFLNSSLRVTSRLLLPSILTVSVAITINDRFFETTKVTGVSMAPTISPEYGSSRKSDYVGWRKLQPTRNLRHGDVVHFASPVRPEAIAVKRVVAMEGDLVLLDPRRRPYSNSTEDGECPESRSWDAWEGRVVVPQGHVWVEGDNWRSSVDSNWYGPLSKSLICGKAVGVVLPVERFGQTPWKGWTGGNTKVVHGHMDPQGWWAIDEI